MSLVFVAVVIAFYVMFMRPIQKDQEKHRQQIRDLRIGDKVLTTSNFVAPIRDIQVVEKGQSRITMELAPGVLVTAYPAAILQRIESAADEQLDQQSTGSERASA